MTKSEAGNDYVPSPIASGHSSDDEQHHSNLKAAIPTEKGVVSHFTEEIRPTMFAESQLLILTFCTGIQGTCRPIVSWPSPHR